MQFNNFSNVPPLDAILSVTNVDDAHYAAHVAAPSHGYMTNQTSLPAAGRMFVGGPHVPSGSVPNHHAPVMSLHHVN